jgi:transposase
MVAEDVAVARAPRDHAPSAQRIRLDDLLRTAAATCGRRRLPLLLPMTAPAYNVEVVEPPPAPRAADADVLERAVAALCDAVPAAPPNAAAERREVADVAAQVDVPRQKVVQILQRFQGTARQRLAEEAVALLLPSGRLKRGAAKALAARFGVSRKTVRKIIDAGGVAKPRGGYHPRGGVRPPWHAPEKQAQIVRAVQANPKLSVRELIDEVFPADQGGAQPRPSTMYRLMTRKLGMAHKAAHMVDGRTVPAEAKAAGDVGHVDRERDKLVAERQRFRQAQRNPDSVLHYPTRLMFMDESTLSTNEQQRYAWGPANGRPVLARTKGVPTTVTLMLTIAPGRPPAGVAFQNGMQAYVVPFMPLAVGEKYDDSPVIVANDPRLLLLGDDYMDPARPIPGVRKDIAALATATLIAHLHSAGVASLDTEAGVDRQAPRNVLVERLRRVQAGRRVGLPIYAALRKPREVVEKLSSVDVFRYLRNQVRAFFEHVDMQVERLPAGAAAGADTRPINERLLVWDNNVTHGNVSAGQDRYASWWHANMHAKTRIRNVVFTPARSPDKNPCEMALAYVKRYVRHHCPPGGEYTDQGLRDAVMQACRKITPEMIDNWTAACGYGPARDKPARKAARPLRRAEQNARDHAARLKELAQATLERERPKGMRYVGPIDNREGIERRVPKPPSRPAAPLLRRFLDAEPDAARALPAPQPYTLRTIHTMRKVGNRNLYLVEWEGYPRAADFTWEPSANIGAWHLTDFKRRAKGKAAAPIPAGAPAPPRA